MANNGSMKIAGKRTVDDWNELELKLDADSSLWDDAFNVYFMTRLETRYLKPIRLLQMIGKDEGEGFSIVSLQCALIEFLQTTRDGYNFKHDGEKKYPPETGNYYGNNQSKIIFTKFLSEQMPFKDFFYCSECEKSIS